ncbi:aminopeptidase N [Actinomyces sp. oral taxon 172]|uniref:aminopeptidase N n=1 Tax=Actinomyces sp. oral taxon 172 TaxID=712118 RepID=UPI000396481F|nr:aminopeptidase N [Actinomyces sp. oral taxon 172]ERH32201.1 membrane alanyl aminopeptidase [Actinomyces sp. oral taxon 172 str. F0311]
MQILTRNEATHRAATLEVSSIDVTVDVSGAADSSQETYPVTSVLTLTAREERTFIDIVGQVRTVLLNGAEHPFEDDEDRVWVSGLPVGESFTLEVRALAHYSRSGEGLHRYTDPEDGEVYLYTQFEPNDAHRAWPCIDQPDVKPEWTFHVIAPPSWVVFSNGVEVGATPAGDDAVRHDFSATPPLSSYITAVVAGPWAVIDGGTWSGGASDGGHVELPLRLACRRTLARYLDADDVCEVTRAGLDFFHERYGVTFPWGSYDQIYVPEYNLGAMENPGCITFNESYISRSTPTFTERQRRANTTLHEMCHMWFGDLATPAWWDDLWLKESFAENQGASAIATSTQYTGEWANFAMNRKIWAYTQDQMPTTHPIAADIPDVAAAKTNFDGITYAKGAAVLKQLVAWVGEDAFYEGARRYFDKHRFAATSLADLLEALEAASHQELGSWKSAWLETSGPSTLSASWRTDPVGAISDFTLHQGAEACGGVLRPHRVTVSTWRAASGALERTHVFDVRIDGESAPIDPDGVLALPGGAAFVDLVVINDDDLTYAISRLDERSTDVALAYVGTIGAPITRAVVWASLWNAVRDGLLDPRRFVVAVLNAVPAETEPAIRDRLLLFVSEALSSFLPGAARADAHGQVLATTIRLAKEADDADAWRAYTRAFIAEFAARGGDEYEATVRAFAASDNPDIAWRARRALAARGLVDEETILAWRDADGSGEAARMSVEALASIPDEAARARAWESAWSDTLSNDYLSATLAGLQSSTWEGERGIGEAVARMRGYWESHTIGMSLRYVSGVLDLSVDIDREGSVEASVSLLGSWLGANEDAPAQLRRIVVEHLDDFERRERVQRRWQGDQ